MTNTEITNLPVMTSFVSPRSGVTLVVNGGSFGVVPVEDVISGKCPRVEMRCSQDGRGFQRGVWHTESDGPESEGVWVEVWTPGGCEFHGVVDSVSRKVVQVG